ncbi:4811_t:CDS:2 [Rhizophagus irregularis]|nr:4811_t:CDS:2 [Rhizophagus irregularis]
MLLIKELVNNKVHFERLEENQFYLKNFTFKNELFYNSPRILFDVKKSLPQEPIVEKTTLVLTMFQPILTLNPGNSIDLFELLSIFDIILSFIKELSISHSDMLIMDFVNQWLKLAKLDTSKYKIFSDFSLKHIVELYELIEEQNVNNSIIHNINDKFKIILRKI